VDPVQVPELQRTVDVDREWLDRTGTLYFLEVDGKCMTGAGIQHGDLLGIRPQNTANDGDIVVASVSGRRMVKVFCHFDGHAWLIPAAPGYHSVLADNAVIFGVVTGVAYLAEGVIHHRDEEQNQ
jgi:SOS-response transcriptional repressor LexA